MTFEERMAELGVDLSDIPAQHSMAILLDKRGRHIMTTGRTLELLEELARADDIIDRMEWALENVLGDRDWLIKQVEQDCLICANADPRNHRVCGKYDDLIPDDCFEFGGVPEDWRVDDEQ